MPWHPGSLEWQLQQAHIQCTSLKQDLERKNTEYDLWKVNLIQVQAAEKELWKSDAVEQHKQIDRLELQLAEWTSKSEVLQVE